MTKATKINVSGTWKNVKIIWKNVSGVWQPGIMSWRNISCTWKECMVIYRISTDVNAINMAYGSVEWSGYCAVNVTPNTMDTTITLIDTGDDTNWIAAGVDGATNTGDFSFRAQSTRANPGPGPRTCTARISDDDGDAISKDVTITQDAPPV